MFFVLIAKQILLLRRTKMIIELLDKYHVDEFDDLLIQIINHMKEQKETRQEKEDQVHQ